MIAQKSELTLFGWIFWRIYVYKYVIYNAICLRGQ